MVPADPRANFVFIEADVPLGHFQGLFDSVATTSNTCKFVEGRLSIRAKIRPGLVLSVVAHDEQHLGSLRSLVLPARRVHASFDGSYRDGSFLAVPYRELLPRLARELLSPEVQLAPTRR